MNGSRLTFEQKSFLPIPGDVFRYVLSIEKELPDKLVGDHVRLKQVLVNLIKNAIKFSPRKDICIKAAYHPSEQMLTVHVVDQGKGIRQDEMSKLFKLFGKFERTEDINQEGIGMGLKIC